MKYLLDFIYFFALLAYSPKIIYRAVKQKRYRNGWAQRLGKITRKNPAKKCIWIHAVSVGEVNATKTIVAELKKRLDDYEIVISATTDTGFERAEKLYGGELSVFYYPFDFSSVIRRAFKNLRPDICLLMELEVWPNLTAYAKKHNIPVVVLNGRISDNSFPKYKLIRPLVKPLFSKVALFLAQSNEYSERFCALGGRKEAAAITGSLKYDTAETTESIPGTEKLANMLDEDQRLFVAGGTGPGEEKIILDVFKKLKANPDFGNVRLAIVPRKPERFDEVADLIVQSGFSITRYSIVKTGQSDSTVNDNSVILGDTMGDLRKFYSLATLVFVGRSLVPMGGSDMAEATAMGKCTIFGTETFNFKQTVDALLAKKGAIEVRNKEQLFEQADKCLSNPEYADAIAANGRKVIIENQGATQKTIDAIVNLLH
ncbi:MAG: 3-deoxy-D-manno-octulosonic acid transferase [Phycisphaerae bacterium]|nr:3-deoxy-D-manno-octulosonic acid transferase [Phycisphaerae bacterium]